MDDYCLSINSLIFFCLRGSTVCDRNGILSSVAKCVPAPCKVVAPSNGTLGKCHSTLGRGKSCEIGCNAEYNPSGKTFCDANGVLHQAQCTKCGPGYIKVNNGWYSRAFSNYLAKYPTTKL